MNETHAYEAPAAGDGRGPCPALNTLANHGYLPRHGRVTVEDLVRAIAQGIGVSKVVSLPIAKMAMTALGKNGVLDLQDLHTPGVIEHDASLSRADATFARGGKPEAALIEQLCSLSQDGVHLTFEDISAGVKARVLQSTVDVKGRVLGLFEAAMLFLVLSRAEGAGPRRVRVADLRSFLQDERLPNDFQRNTVTLPLLLAAVARMSVQQSSMLSPGQRGQGVARRTEGSGCPFHAVLKPR